MQFFNGEKCVLNLCLLPATVCLLVFVKLWMLQQHDTIFPAVITIALALDVICQTISARTWSAAPMRLQT